MLYNTLNKVMIVSELFTEWMNSTPCEQVITLWTYNTLVHTFVYNYLHARCYSGLPFHRHKQELPCAIDAEQSHKFLNGGKYFCKVKYFFIILKVYVKIFSKQAGEMILLWTFSENKNHFINVKNISKSFCGTDT